MDPDFAAHRDRLRPDFSARKTRLGSGAEPTVTPGPRHAPPEGERRNRLAARLVLIAALWSLGLVIAAVALPVYDTTTESNSAGTTLVTTTLVAGQGAWVLIPVLVPLVISAVVALALRSRHLRRGAGTLHARIAWAAVALLAAFCLFSIASIGGFAIPVVLLLGRATMLTKSPNPAAAAPRGQDRAPRARRA